MAALNKHYFSFYSTLFYIDTAYVISAFHHAFMPRGVHDPNIVPTAFSASKMAAWRIPWETADHGTLNKPITKPAADFK